MRQAPLQLTVALLSPRQSADGVRRVEHLDLVSHLVVTVWMAGPGGPSGRIPPCYERLAPNPTGGQTRFTAANP